ncbi:MAG: serine/threonine-protein kinase [Ghiorsea sp.]
MTELPNHNQEQELVVLGSYDLEGRLGQGGMGIVYLATDRKLNRQVAIKVLHPHLLRHENLKERFRREARMHAKLMHPNIVTLLSLYEDDSHMALVMEMVHGQDLKAYLRSNPNMPLQEKLDVGIHILTGLEAAHKFGMVHRDLKPANVLISKQHEVKLMDFGLAKPERGDDDLTQSGATVGSFRYMSPEQILNQPIDARTDLYAFGILMFQMTTGKLPFDATSNGGEFEIMEKQVREIPENPHAINTAIPKALSQLILSLLEKNKEDRPKNTDAVRQQIRDIREQLGDYKDSPTHASSPEHDFAAAPPSNAEVAQQWLKIAKYRVQDLMESVVPLLKRPKIGLAAFALIFVMLGAVVIGAMGSSDSPASAQADVKKIEPNKITKVIQPTVVEKKSAPEPVKQVVIVPKTEAVVVKQEPPVKKVAPKPAKKVVKKYVRSITYQVKHKVSRSDDSKVSSRKRHEFRGGKHLFYPGLEEKTWFTSYERGESMVTFNKPVKLSKIVLHKASVGRLNFKGGYVYLDIQGVDGEWKRLFERKDDDVDIQVTIRKVHSHMKKIKAVRLQFKTPEPITVGPIDLLR